MTTDCTGCGRPLMEVSTLSGARVLLEPEPDPGRGRWVLSRLEDDDEAVAIALTGLLPLARQAARRERIDLYVEHACGDG